MKLTSFFVVCSLLTSQVYAGNVVVRNVKSHSCVAVQQIHQQVIQEVIPVNVAFVPSQVLLNGQVTTYGTAQQVNYSYQGPLAVDCTHCQPQQPQQPVPNPPHPGEQDQVDPTPVIQSIESKTLDARINRLESMVEKLLKANGLEAEPPIKTLSQGTIDFSHQVLNNNCVKCHKPGSSGSFEKLGDSGYTMTDATGNLFRDQDWKRIASVSCGPDATMPKGPVKLTQNEQEALVARAKFSSQ